MWTTKSEYNWDTQEALLNTFHHYTTTIENLRIHFVHERSKEQDAIPLLMLHGWPGSFTEFLPTILPLTQAATTVNGEKVSFHVVAASLPGFTFSSPTPANWTTNNTAEVFHHLMTEVLGYSNYAVHGTDRGGPIGYYLYGSYPERVGAAHFNSLPFVAPTRQQLMDEGITLSSVGELAVSFTEDMQATGHGYFDVQTNKPNTIGFALYDNPLGQLSWIAEKYVLWSDPHFFNKSNVNDTSVLDLVTLYYLTSSFVSAEYIYSQNPNSFSTVYTKANTSSPLLFTAVPYNTYFPREYVAKIGNLTRYTELDRGGHFLGLDNTHGLINELREIKTYW